jgi:hypothetical protein
MVNLIYLHQHLNNCHFTNPHNTTAQHHPSNSKPCPSASGPSAPNANPSKLDVCNFWNEMASGYGLTRRIQALETWQENTDIALLRLMRDVTVAERKLNMILPLDEDEDDGTTERASTARTSSLDVSSENNIGPTLLPGGTPVTFTRRKSNSAERVTLDGSGLRLPGPARSAEAHKSRSVG